MKKASDRIRFEVFKRDSFTCQYCGRKAPDVVLNADHIAPLAGGGETTLLNLVTSCRDCNSGKSNVPLSEGAAVAKAQGQAEALEERRQQIEMMAEWQVELASLSPEMEAIGAILTRVADKKLTDQGRKGARQLVRKYGLEQVMQSIAIAFDRYDHDQAWGMVAAICRNRAQEQSDPAGSNIRRVLNAIIKPFGWDARRYREALAIIDGWRAEDLDPMPLMRAAEKGSHSWYAFLRAMNRINEGPR